MRRDEFRGVLTSYGYSDEQIVASEEGVSLLENYLAGLQQPIALDHAPVDILPSFLGHTIAENANERSFFVGMYHYTGMVKNYDLQVGLLELLDGFEILGNLHRVIGEELGEVVQSQVFDGVELPEIGTGPKDWARVNSVIFPRLEALADSETVKRILRSGLRNLPDAAYLPIKERYEEIGDIDAFLDDRGRRHLEQLIEHRDEGTPYFSQMIDDSVVEFVRTHPEIGRGVRNGNTIVETKIPHESIEYLAAADLPTQQHHACHCPLVKDSIGNNDLEISPTFCEFCPSFNAKPWEVIFGQKLEYEVLESAKRGGKWCRFAIHLPVPTQ